MIYISFIELYQESQTNLCDIHGPVNGKMLTALSFFFGITLMALINEFIPEANHPHRARRIDPLHKLNISCSSRNTGKLMKTGVFTAIAVTLHNFPEGIASYVSTMKNSALGVSIALAIAIHNIPEGIAISIPVYYSTGSRKKALLAALFPVYLNPGCYSRNGRSWQTDNRHNVWYYIWRSCRYYGVYLS